MRTIEKLIEAVQREAERASFPVDREVYEKAGKDPARPILFAGSLDAPICAGDEVAIFPPVTGG